MGARQFINPLLCLVATTQMPQPVLK